jgi:hypothetical protein
MNHRTGIAWGVLDTASKFVIVWGVLGTPGLLRRELSKSAVAAGEYSYFVFMIPSSHSNPEQITNREFETLLFFYLIVVLLNAGRRILWRPPQRWRSGNVGTMVLELLLMLLLFLKLRGP